MTVQIAKVVFKMQIMFGKFLICFWALSLANIASANENVANAFIKEEVAPDVIENPPMHLLEVIYDNGLSVNFGNELTPTQVKNQPKINYDAEESAYYTLIMTDPDAPRRLNPTSREFKHWLVVNIPKDNINEGEVLAGYVGSGPPQGTGLHRYVFLLYKQPGKLEFSEKRVGNNSREERPKFKASVFAKKYNLGEPIAGNFYQAQYDDYVPTVHAQLSGN